MHVKTNEYISIVMGCCVSAAFEQSIKATERQTRATMTNLNNESRKLL